MLATLGCIASQGSGGTVIDRTTPVTVVNSAYDTSGNCGRKLVMLSNGWLISVLWNLADTTIYFRKSIDNGLTWTELCNANMGASNAGIAIASVGNIVHCLFTPSNSTSAIAIKFDATIVPNISLNTQGGTYFKYPDASQSGYFNGCSLAIDTNRHLHATWSSKNATYPNSFNIRYSKSTDGGNTWSTPKQINANNSTGTDATSPNIVFLANGHPIIVFLYKLGTQYVVYRYTFNGFSWGSGGYIYDGNTYAQSSPSATVDSNGVIHVVWHGADATDTTQNNIRYSKSADNGATWSTMVKLTNDSTTGRQDVSITSNKNNELFILYYNNNRNIIKMKTTSGTWGSEVQLTSNTTGNANYPSTCDNYKDFEEPLAIWQDNQTPSVKFYGKWTVA